MPAAEWAGRTQKEVEYSSNAKCDTQAKECTIERFLCTREREKQVVEQAQPRKVQASRPVLGTAILGHRINDVAGELRQSQAGDA